MAINANSPNFFPANTYKDTESTEDLPLDLPKFSLPFASTVAICQNFTPPKFSRVQYMFNGELKGGREMGQNSKQRVFAAPLKLVYSALDKCGMY